MQAAFCRSDAPVAISFADLQESPRGRGSHKTNFAGLHQQCARPKKKPCMGYKALKIVRLRAKLSPERYWRQNAPSINRV